MDILYPLGMGSPWNDNELRYSLRAVEKHLTGWDRVFIIGRKPNWIQNVEFIEAKDDQGNKEKNIAWKIIKGCQTDISDRFLFMNDDHILCANTGVNVPYYYSMTIQQMILRRNAGNVYRKAMQNTLDVYGFEAKYFDIHVPIVYDKKIFPEIMESLDWSKDGGYVVKSCYGNAIGAEGEVLQDHKVNTKRTIIEYEAMTHGRFCFSFGDRTIGPTFRMFMEKLYPQKSKFEK